MTGREGSDKKADRQEKKDREKKRKAGIGQRQDEQTDRALVE